MFSITNLSLTAIKCARFLYLLFHISSTPLQTYWLYLIVNVSYLLFFYADFITEGHPDGVKAKEIDSLLALSS